MQNIIVTGGTGFLGSRVALFLKEKYSVFVPTRAEYDLRFEQNVQRMYYDAGKTDCVVHVAATVGGIGSTKAYPADYITDNLIMGANVIRQAHVNGVEKVVIIGSVCEYPEHCPVPFNESNLWDGYPEPTNAPYGISKRALGSMLQSYYQQYSMKGAYLVMCNLYGPGDNFDPESSHVIPALIMKMYNAKENGDESVTLWGTGTPSRDFLYVNDAAEAIVLATENIDRPEPINIGTGQETIIFWLADKIKDMIGYTGEIVWDDTKPDGQKRRAVKTLKAKRLLGWENSINIEEGLEKTIAWYKEVMKND